jgi:hypothetical protein
MWGWEGDVSAASPEAAKQRVLAREWPGHDEEVGRVEVMRKCDCGCVTSLDEKVCEDCGAAL